MSSKKGGGPHPNSAKNRPHHKGSNKKRKRGEGEDGARGHISTYIPRLPSRKEASASGRQEHLAALAAKINKQHKYHPEVGCKGRRIAWKESQAARTPNEDGNKPAAATVDATDADDAATTVPSKLAAKPLRQPKPASARARGTVNLFSALMPDASEGEEEEEENEDEGEEDEEVGQKADRTVAPTAASLTTDQIVPSPSAAEESSVLNSSPAEADKNKDATSIEGAKAEATSSTTDAGNIQTIEKEEPSSKRQKSSKK